MANTITNSSFLIVLQDLQLCILASWRKITTSSVDSIGGVGEERQRVFQTLSSTRSIMRTRKNATVDVTFKLIKPCKYVILKLFRHTLASRTHFYNFTNGNLSHAIMLRVNVHFACVLQILVNIRLSSRPTKNLK